MPMITIAARASVALALAVLAAPVFAGAAPNQPETVVNARHRLSDGETVTVRASDLGNAGAQGALIGRIKTAAAGACAARPGVELDPMPGYNPCIDALVADARVALPSRAEFTARGGSLDMILR